MSLQFLHLDAIVWLWAVIVAGIVAGAAIGWRRRIWRKLATAPMRDQLRASTGKTRHGMRSVMVVTALALLVVALMDPRWGVQYTPVAQRNIDVMFVLDTSRSMKAGDLAPSRLTRARQYIEDVLDHAAGDRVGLVSFAGTSQLDVPLTRDTTAMTLALDAIDVRGGREGGSLLGYAIRLATESFPEDDATKAIIVLSDGEDMGSRPVEAAATAAQHGARIWTVGLGDPDQGARIPVDVDGERLFLTHNGEEVWSIMDPDTLTAVAEAGEGTFIPSGTANVDLGEVYDAVIAPAAGRRTSSAMIERPIPRYHWFVVPALILLIIEWLAGRCWSQTTRSASITEVTP